jgi:hypothetical protein
VGTRAAAGTGRTIWAAVLLGLALASTAAADLISVGGISVSELSTALRSSPVQQRGHPEEKLSQKEIRSLDARIHRRDPGRIWIAVVSPLSPTAAGDLAEAISNAINSDGVYIVVAGSSYHVTTTWESGEAARARLATAVGHPGDSLYKQLERSVDSFATADAAAGHPGASSTEQTGPGSSSPSSSSHSSGSSGNGGTIIAIVVLVILLGSGGLVALRRARGSMRAEHWRKEQTADERAQAETDFGKLGDDIGALDIDSSMPNANPQAKDEYAKALDCYQDAEQRLKRADDAYQFAKAQEALSQGAQHIRVAQQLFSAAPAAPAATAATAATAANTAGVVDRIAKLAALHQQGALTDAEFAAEKQKLLGD